MFWTVLLATLLALGAMGVLMAVAIRPLGTRLMNQIMDYAWSRMVSLDYTKNPFGILNVNVIPETFRCIRPVQEVSNLICKHTRDSTKLSCPRQTSR